MKKNKKFWPWLLRRLCAWRSWRAAEQDRIRRRPQMNLAAQKKM